MKLKELLAEIEVEAMKGSLEVEIRGIAEDSRQVAEGFLFVAREGSQVDGHRYIGHAVNQGAVAIVREDGIDDLLPVTQIRVRDTAEALGKLSAAFYHHPERSLFLIGVTGTNGKSSVAWMVKEALKKARRGCGLIGTLIYDTGKDTFKARETTPPAPSLYKLLSQMVENGLDTAVLEVSSHALDQKRVAGLTFKVAVFTNLSRDHLDYHRDLSAYFAAKKRLFTDYLVEGGMAIINMSDPWGRRLREALSSGVGVWALGKDFQARILSRTEGLVLEIREPEGCFVVPTRLFGDFQRENFLAAWAVLRALGFAPEEVRNLLLGVSAPPGRLEPVAECRGGRIFVDYAHTPEALRVALESARKLASGRVLCVFGCGGNRDPGKRPVMGRVAAELADVIFLTSDNPRFEDPEAIVADILQGLNGFSSYEVIVDRREAFKEAIAKLGPGDVLLIAGKGHEDYQEIKGKRYPFSDAEEVRKIVAKEGGQ